MAASHCSQVSHCDWTESFNGWFIQELNIIMLLRDAKNSAVAVWNYFLLAKWSKNRQYGLSLLILTYCLLNCCIKSISQSCLFLNKKWHSSCDCNYMKWYIYIHIFCPHILNFVIILNAFYKTESCSERTHSKCARALV